jgi:hypothetical protein
MAEDIYTILSHLTLAIFLSILIISIIVFILFKQQIKSYFQKRVENVNKKIKKSLTFKNSGCINPFQESTSIFTILFWSDITPVALTTVVTILILLIALFLEYNLALKIIIIALITVVYAKTLINFRKKYEELVALAKELLEKFELELLKSLESEVDFKIKDPIESFEEKEELFGDDKRLHIFKFVTSTKTLPNDFLNPKNKIVSEKSFEFLIIGGEFIAICRGATPFELLKLKLSGNECKDMKKSAGKCEEHYFSYLRNVKLDGKSLKLITEDGEEILLLESGAKELQKAFTIVRDKIRIIERRRAKKVDERYKFRELTKEEPPPQEERENPPKESSEVSKPK